jgi:hypothetical protein
MKSDMRPPPQIEQQYFRIFRPFDRQLILFAHCRSVTPIQLFRYTQATNLRIYQPHHLL